MIRSLSLFVSLIALPVMGQELRLPGNAAQTVTTVSSPESLAIATGPFEGGALPTVAAEGTLTRAAWRIPGSGITTLQMLRPLREQLRNAGFVPVYECKDTACGGFDFRFGLDLLPPPSMQVNLLDFRYFAARKDDAFVAVMISRTGGAGYIAIDRVGSGAAPEAQTSAAPIRTETVAAPTDISGGLESIGRVVLGDLAFETGSAQLADGAYGSLADLAAYLNANPTLKIALVGHTDSEGSLNGNIALSKRRAGAVLERLVSAHDIPRRQLSAEGNGFLSPIANNLQAEGREANRRVEAIVISTGE